MGLAWWDALGKDNRGSRPRCVLLADGNGCALTNGNRRAVAARLTELVNLPNVTVSPDDRWMPCGKPVCTDKGWDKNPAAEAQIDRDDGFVEPKVRQQLVDWWLEVVPGANTPHWDVAATCNADGRKGLILVEAKAHSNELSGAGKSKPTTDNGWKNHARIGSAIEEANTGLRRVAGGTWQLSRDEHYQLANRFAWSWKLASLGVPVVLIYLGFLNAKEMARDGVLFRSKSDWTRTLKDHARGVADEACWGKHLKVNGTSLRPVIRVAEVPFPPTCSGA